MELCEHGEHADHSQHYQEQAHCHIFIHSDFTEKYFLTIYLKKLADLRCLIMSI